MTTSVSTCPQLDKALAIAQDALEQLDLHPDCIMSGGYLTSWGQLAGEERSAVAAAGDLRDVLSIVQKSCTVCLLGACLLSKADLYDDVPLAPFRFKSRGHGLAADGCMTYSALQPIFGASELRKLESFFERHVMVGPELEDSPGWTERPTPGSYEWEELCSCGEAANAYKHIVDRARAALTNFIKNNGRLVVEDFPVEQGLLQAHS